MTKGELAVIVKKVQAECGLEDPTKITYYRDEEGRVVFKLWFDSLILPETLAGKKKGEFEWQANVNYAVWQTCGACGDDYSGYLLFPTHKDNEYFVLWYKS